MRKGVTMYLRTRIKRRRERERESRRSYLHQDSAALERATIRRTPRPLAKDPFKRRQRNKKKKKKSKRIK